MHQQVREYAAHKLVGRHYPSVVEVGGRWINGGVRDLVDCDTYVSLDLYDGDGVDVVADVCDWKPDAPVDLVICCEVIEHAPEPQAVVEACVGMLAPGGTLLLTCAGPDRAPHSGLDGGPVREDEHYRNIKPAEMKRWLADLDADVEYHADRGDLYAFATKAEKPKRRAAK